jgi:nicotinamidase/pyrazinamidase
MFHPDLRLPASVVLLSKGIVKSVDGYSAFDGMTEAGRTLTDLLTENGIDHLCIGGLATDYCVRATVLDALGRGLTVTVLLDGIAGVNLQPDDADPAIDEMRQVGASVLRVDELKVQ